MTPRTPSRTRRRTEALTRDRIVAAAVALLDHAGESGLTSRALTGALATGPGAIHHHVGNRDELLAAATDAVVAAALAVRPAAADGTARPPSPREEVHAVALGLFDAIAEHPWLSPQIAVQLSRHPWASVATRIFEGLGRQVGALGVPEDRWFTAASALMHYVLGAAGLNGVNAAHGRDLAPHVDRAGFLDVTARTWEELDPDAYPFTRAVADRLRHHDDREEFLAGLDLVLDGIDPTGLARDHGVTRRR